MRAELTKVWQDLQGSYYFIPAIMALGAVLLAIVTLKLDQTVNPDIFKTVNILAANSVEGTRSILSVIAGSMISVTGITFSLTMVAVTNAAAQYGPRLIGNFMRDRANQFTLGVFTATFIYSLLILRVAHVGEDEGVEDRLPEFIPNLSVLCAMLLTLLSVGVLIYFIHHIPETLNVGNITSKVGRNLRDNLRKLVNPEISGSERIHLEIDVSDYDPRAAIQIKARSEGYVQALDMNSLLNIAVEEDLLISLRFQPGDFVVSGDNLVDVWHADGMTAPDCEIDTLADSVRSCYAMGRQRTVHQNPLYLADELVEILARALSPGVNDPFTAVNCMHWYESALTVMLSGRVGTANRFDEENRLRIIAQALKVDDLLETFCGQSRAYVAGDKIATMAMLSMLSKLRAKTDREDIIHLLDLELSFLVRAAGDSLPNVVDREIVAAHASEIIKIQPKPIDIRSL